MSIRDRKTGNEGGSRATVMIAIASILVLAIVGIWYGARPKGGGQKASSTLQTAAGQVDSEKILFVSDRDGNEEIYIMNSDGSEQANLTQNNAQDRDPAWSPDRTKIAFASDREGMFQIYVMNSDGTNVVRLTSPDTLLNYSPAWSPDGKQIAFVSARDGSAQLYVMNADGSDQRRVAVTKGDVDNPSWFPDGKSILFTASEGNGCVERVNLDGSGLEVLTKPDQVVKGGACSPDGKYAAMTTYNRTNRSQAVTILTLADLSANVISKDFNVVEADPAWSPSGKYIAYSSDKGGTSHIYIMPAQGGEPVQLTSGTHNDRSPAW
ncbi:MAG TPA: hypothetical protein GX509_02595 [Firmicutes bacterium]|nr:hypothetical protein [Bacillota bacterium]